MMSVRFLISFFLVTGGSSLAATWSEINSGLPSAVPGVIAVTVDLQTPSTLYARTPEGAVFKSTDGAGSWRLLRSVAGVASLVVDPKTSSTVYASTGRGVVLKSTNGGESWIGASSGLSAPFGTLTIDPVTPSTLYAASYLNGVFKSVDAGGRWKALYGVPRNTFEIVVDPLTPSTIYAPSDMGIFKSTDGGESWSAMGAVGYAMAIAPTDPSTIYAGARGGAIIKSDDGGQSWSTIDIGLDPRAAIRSLQIDPSLPSTVYITYHANTGVGFLKSTDGGASWNAIHEGLPAGETFIRSLAIDPVSSTIYAANYDVRTGGGGVFKSTGGGATWDRADAGLIDIDIRALAIDPTNAATVYTGGRGGLFRSLDGGTTWTNLTTFQLPAPNWFSQPPPVGAGPAHTRSLLIDSASPNVLYARTIRYNAWFASDNLLFKSRDGGATWSDSVSPRGSGYGLSDVLVMDPANPDTLYTSVFDDGSSLLKSANGGASWTTIWWRDCFINALVIDPTNPAILYAGLGDTSESPVNGLVKSWDGGVSWTTVGLAGSAVTVIATSPADPSILYASTEGFNSDPRGFRGLFKSTDGGAGWFAINHGLDSLLDTRFRITALVIGRDNPNLLYAGTAGAGVLRSTDAGATWSPFNAGLANFDVRMLALAPGDPRTLYAGTPSGVFKIIDDVAAF